MMELLTFTASIAPRVKLVTVEQCWTVCEGSRLSSPYDARDFLVPYFQGKDREHFVVLHLDGSHRPISVEVVPAGALNSAPVHPREVFKAALLANAQGNIAAHNHPSGDLEPSKENHRVFTKLKAAGDLLGITLLDFVVASGTQFRSLVDPHIGGE